VQNGTSVEGPSVTSSQKFISIVRQPCRRILFNKEDLGQWLYVPSFRTVCLFQDSLYDFKDYAISSRSLAILPFSIIISAIKEKSLLFFHIKSKSKCLMQFNSAINMPRQFTYTSVRWISSNACDYNKLDSPHQIQGEKLFWNLTKNR